MDSDPTASEEGLTYAEAGVDIEASESATAALVAVLEGGPGGSYAGVLDLGDRYLGLTTDGVGTKLLVAAALGDFSTIGIDCIAMNVNDLVAAGLEPVAFVDYLAVDQPDEAIAEQIGRGLKEGARRADVALVGGETAVMPEVITGLDLAGAAVGVAPTDGLIPGEAAVGDVLVGFPSSGVHSNGLTLARRAVGQAYDFTDPTPWDQDRTVGEALLEPTAMYTDLLGPMREVGVHGAAHITGGGWTNLSRLGEHRFRVTDPIDPHPIFALIRTSGGVSEREMYRTFNMGTGFVVAAAPDAAEDLLAATNGRIVGRVEEGSAVIVEDLVVAGHESDSSTAVGG